MADEPEHRRSPLGAGLAGRLDLVEVPEERLQRRRLLVDLGEEAPLRLIHQTSGSAT